MQHNLVQTWPHIICGTKSLVSQPHPGHAHKGALTTFLLCLVTCSHFAGCRQAGTLEISQVRRLCTTRTSLVRTYPAQAAPLLYREGLATQSHQNRSMGTPMAPHTIIPRRPDVHFRHHTSRRRRTGAKPSPRMSDHSIRPGI